MKKFKTVPTNREQRIRILLIERNLTCKTLAEALEISEPLLTYKLRNDSWKPEEIEFLIKFFEIKASDLLNITGKSA
jgi:hypothetical protein